MPLFSDLSSLSLYYGGSANHYFSPSPYSSHSSILSSNYRQIPSYGTSRVYGGRGFTPHLATIGEGSAISSRIAGISRINSPKLLSHSSPKYKVSRPVSINTADIDVSKNRYRKHLDRAAITSPRKIVSTDKYKDKSVSSVFKTSPSSYTPIADKKNREPLYEPKKKENDTDAIFMPRVDDTFRSTIKRGRTVVRLHTVRLKENPALAKKNTEQADDPNNNCISSIDDTVQQIKPLIDSDNKTKRLIEPTENVADSDKKEEEFNDKGKEEQEEKMEIVQDEEPNKLNKHKTKRKSNKSKMVVEKSPSFHDICRSISSDRIDSDLNAGQTTINRMAPHRKSRKMSSPNILKEIRRNSAEILQEHVKLLDSILKNENVAPAVDLDKMADTTEAKNKSNRVESRTNTQELCDGHENDKKKKKVYNKKKSSDELVIDSSENKCLLQRRPTLKNLRRTSSTLSELTAVENDTDILQKDSHVNDDNKKDKKLAKNRAKISATVEIQNAKPKMKFVIDDIQVEKIETPSPSKLKKFKFNVTVDVDKTKDYVSARKDNEKNTNDTEKRNIKVSENKSKTEKSVSEVMKKEFSADKTDNTDKDTVTVLKTKTEIDDVKRQGPNVTKTKKDLKSIETPAAAITTIESINQKEDTNKRTKIKQNANVTKTEEELVVKKTEIKKDTSGNKLNDISKNKSKTIDNKSTGRPQVNETKALGNAKAKKKVVKQKSKEDSTDDFWSQIGKRETIYYKDRRKFIEERTIQARKETFWSDEAYDETPDVEKINVTENVIDVKGQLNQSLDSKQIETTVRKEDRADSNVSSIITKPANKVQTQDTVLSNDNQIGKIVTDTVIETKHITEETIKGTNKKFEEEEKVAVGVLNKNNLKESNKNKIVNTENKSKVQKDVSELSTQKKVDTQTCESATILANKKISLDSKNLSRDNKKLQQSTNLMKEEDNISKQMSEKNEEISESISLQKDKKVKTEDKPISSSLLTPDILDTISEASDENMSRENSSKSFDAESNQSLPKVNHISESVLEKVKEHTEKEQESLQENMTKKDLVKIKEKIVKVDAVKKDTVQKIQVKNINQKKEKAVISQKNEQTATDVKYVKKLTTEVKEENIVVGEKIVAEKMNVEKTKEKNSTEKIALVQKNVEAKETKQKTEAKLILENKSETETMVENDSVMDLDKKDKVEESENKIADNEPIKSDFKDTEEKDTKSTVAPEKVDTIPNEVKIDQTAENSIQERKQDTIVPKLNEEIKIKPEILPIKPSALMNLAIMEPPKPKRKFFKDDTPAEPIMLLATPRDLRRPPPRRPPPPPSPETSSDESDSDDESTSSSEDSSTDSDDSSSRDDSVEHAALSKSATDKRTSTSSNDSGFDSSAPGSPANKYLQG